MAFTIARHHVMKVSKRQQRDLTQNKPIDEEFDDVTPDRGIGVNEHHDFIPTSTRPSDCSTAGRICARRLNLAIRRFATRGNRSSARYHGISGKSARLPRKTTTPTTTAPFIKELQ